MKRFLINLKLDTGFSHEKRIASETSPRRLVQIEQGKAAKALIAKAYDKKVSSELHIPIVSQLEL